MYFFDVYIRTKFSKHIRLYRYDNRFDDIINNIIKLFILLYNEFDV